MTIHNHVQKKMYLKITKLITKQTFTVIYKKKLKNTQLIYISSKNNNSIHYSVML
jgi:hypothetical protein